MQMEGLNLTRPIVLLVCRTYGGINGWNEARFLGLERKRMSQNKLGTQTVHIQAERTAPKTM